MQDACKFSNASRRTAIGILPLVRLMLFVLAFLTGAETSFAMERIGDRLMVKDGEFHLHATEAVLTELLTEISSKTGVKIHYSVLPETLVSATCASNSVKSLLECVLARRVDMAFRYEQVDTGRSERLLEIWLLGSSLAHSEAQDCRDTGGNRQAGMGKYAETTDIDRPEQHEPSPEELLAFRREMAMTGNVSDRVQAIAYLADKAPEDDADYNRVLEEALYDADARIRGEAISALARRKGERAVYRELEQALQDPEVSVRLMALQQITDSAALIGLALQDENDAVRQFAAAKTER